MSWNILMPILKWLWREVLKLLCPRTTVLERQWITIFLMKILFILLPNTGNKNLYLVRSLTYLTSFISTLILGVLLKKWKKLFGHVDLQQLQLDEDYDDDNDDDKDGVKYDGNEMILLSKQYIIWIQYFGLLFSVLMKNLFKILMLIKYRISSKW